MNYSWSLLFTRLLLGIIFFMQGFGKVFNWGVDNVYKNGFAAYKETFLPEFVLQFTAYFTSYGEFIFGFLLLIGLFRKHSYFALGLILLIVSFGHGLTSPVWDLQHVFFRSALLIFLISFPLDKDVFSLDNKLIKK